MTDAVSVTLPVTWAEFTFFAANDVYLVWVTPDKDERSRSDDGSNAREAGPRT